MTAEAASPSAIRHIVELCSPVILKRSIRPPRSPISARNQKTKINMIARATGTRIVTLAPEIRATANTNPLRTHIISAFDFDPAACTASDILIGDGKRGRRHDNTHPILPLRLDKDQKDRHRREGATNLFPRDGRLVSTCGDRRDLVPSSRPRNVPLAPSLGGRARGRQILPSTTGRRRRTTSKCSRARACVAAAIRNRRAMML